MTPEELAALLEGKNIHQVLDIKTVVLDILKKQSPEELEGKFNEVLPQLSHNDLKGYFYMNRG
ncbi:MAG: hypothetical protein LW809_02450 [Vampirovibrionales bacterium]|jgi:hypothetical protein|nr:hypothetical protein [Vampirovibrionales bacterium]